MGSPGVIVRNSKILTPIKSIFLAFPNVVEFEVKTIFQTSNRLDGVIGSLFQKFKNFMSHFKVKTLELVFCIKQTEWGHLGSILENQKF